MEHLQPAASTAGTNNARRIRFVAMRGPAPASLLRFHPRVTVLSGFDPGLATWLAGSLSHGRDATPDGFAEIDGARVALNALPDAAYDAAPCPRVGGDTLTEDLRHVGGQQSERLGFELQALLDAIDTAKRRIAEHSELIVRLDAEISAAETHIAQLHAAKVPVRRSVVTRDRTEDADHLARLLDAFERAAALPKIEHPAAAALLRALEALDQSARRYRPHDEVERELRKWEMVTAEARTRLAERRANAPRVSAEDLAEATRLRAALKDAKERRSRVLRRRPADEVVALEAELHALFERLGARSYEDLMLLGTGLGSADADLGIREATNVVAAAERRCAELRAELAEPTIEQLREERARLVERAAEVLGHDPGDDPVAALRAFQVEPPAFVDAQVALATALREFGVHVEGTVEETARALVADWRAVRAEQERGQAELQEIEEALTNAERLVREHLAQRSQLTRDIERLRTEVEDLQFDRERLESRLRDDARRSTVTTITPAIVERAVASMLSGVTASPLPIIVEEPFAGLTPELRPDAFDALARRANGRQVILVTDDSAALQWARDVGEDVALAWTAQDAYAIVLTRAARDDT
jgi:hypothetical protein